MKTGDFICPFQLHLVVSAARFVVARPLGFICINFPLFFNLFIINRFYK